MNRRRDLERSQRGIMYVRVLRLVLLSCSVIACSAERVAQTAPLTIDARMNAIDSALVTMRHDTTTVFGLSAEGASIDAAYADSMLRRVDAVFFGETGSARETYYFDSTLFVVVRRDYTYDVPLSGRVVDSTVTRYDLTLETTSDVTKDSLRKSMMELMSRLPIRQ